MNKINNKIATFLGLATIIGAACGITPQDATAQAISVTAGEFTKVGLSGGQFLKIGVGARGAGMGGAYSAVANDVTSIYWNPAGLTSVKAYAANVSHSFWFAGMAHSFAAGVIPVGDKYRAAVSLTSFSSGDIKITTMSDPDGVGGLYSVRDVSLGFTFAGELTEKFSFGITGKYVQHAFTNVSAAGVVFDVGTRYNTGFNGVILGFSVNSLGTEQSFDGSDLTRSRQNTIGLNASPVDMQVQSSSFNMPLSFRAGLGVDMFAGFIADKPEVDDNGTKVHQWTMAADFETYADVPEQLSIGTEYVYSEFLALRAGYRLGNDQFGLSGGVGFKYVSGDFNGSLDYSVSPTSTLGLVNRLSLELNFN